MSNDIDSSVASSSNGRVRPMSTDAIKDAGVQYSFPLDQPINGRYRIVERLGSGGMGVVFRAQDLLLQREVALKILTQIIPQTTKGATPYDIYLNEAKIAASLKDPSIVSIYDFGQINESQDKNPFIVMELVNGQKLLDLMRNTVVALEDVTEIFIQVCDALDYAHSKEQPVLHRDIKPENILVEPDGRVVLIDFGLSRFMGSTSTTVGLFKGSLHYTAPEVVESHFSHDADKYREAIKPTMDLFSLGATFYLALTGSYPVPGNNLYELLQNYRNGYTIEPIDKLNSQMPKSLSDIILQLLAFDPDDRIQSAKEVADRLKVLLDEAVFEPGQPPKRETHPKADQSIIDDVLMDPMFNDIKELDQLREQQKIKEREPSRDEVDNPADHNSSYSPETPLFGRLGPLVGVVGGVCILTLYLLFPLSSSEMQTRSDINDGYALGGATKEQEEAGDKLIASLDVMTERRRPVVSENVPTKAMVKSKPVYRNAGLIARVPSPTNVESFGDEMVVYSSTDGDDRNSKNYGISLGTVIKDVVLNHKLVSYNIASPARAVLRSPFKMNDEIIFPRKALFIGKAEVLPTRDRVHIKFFKVVLPDGEEINFNGIALMADGSNGMVGKVEYRKGKSPAVLAGTNVIGDVGRVAINGATPTSLGGQVGQALADSSLSATQRQLANSAANLPIITVEAYTPLQIFVEVSF